MTKNLVDNTHFLNLLLSTSREQGVALLQTITKEQLLLVSEIAKNIQLLPLPKKAKYLVTKKKKLVTRIADRNLSRTKKLPLIRKNAVYVLSLLLSLKAQLSELQ